MISVVMAYLNRKAQTYRTLKTIEASASKDIEVVIVNDGSDDEHSLEDVISKFPYPIHLINIKKEEKTWINPCVAYNVGFKKASGDIIIIQNPECMHFGDLISHAKNNVKENNYIVYSCLGIGEAILNNIAKHINFDNAHNVQNELNRFLLPLVRGVRGDRATSCWYNHPQFKPRPFHFTSAITRENLLNLGGFDERFANGYWYDDDELLWKIRRKLIVEALPPRDVLSIHQWHPAMLCGDREAKINTNLALFQKIQNNDI